MKRKRFCKPLSTALLTVLCAVFLFPYYVMLAGAFKKQMALQLVPPDLNLFQNITFKNLHYILEKTNIGGWLLNSFTVSLGVALLTVFIGATAGYAFAKKGFRGKKALFALVISTMLLPRQMLLIPNYLVAMELSLTNRLIGLILTTVSPAFGIFLCRQFMQSIPGELLEAAEIDGCRELGRFARIVLPLSAPALGALGIFSFFSAWNDYLWQLIMISDKELQTVPIGIALFSQGQITNVGNQLMAASIATMPMLIIFLCFQKFFVKGITMGGVKG
jgi:multiple sugar transport system permease protein